MQILSIELKNIKSHRERALHFSPGINVLSGPNGVGKSTVFEAIGYALFGVDARDFVGNIERFLTIGAKRGEVAVTFKADDGETYRVSRTVGAAAKWLLAREAGGAFEVEEHAGMAETEARLRELLRLDNGRPLAEQFKLVIGPFQNDFLGPFVIKQPTKRQEAFDEILGIDAWRKTFKGTSSLLAAVQEKIKILAVEVEAKQERVAVLPGKEGQLAELKAAREARQAELKAGEEALAAVTARLGDFDKQKEQLDAVESRLQQTEKSIESGREHIANQTLLVEQAEKAGEVVEQSRPGKEAYERAEALLKELRIKEQQRRALQQEVAELEKESVRLTQRAEHEQGETERAAKGLAEEERQLEERRAELQPSPDLAAEAGRLADLRGELDQVRGDRSRLEGQEVSLREGRDKLAEGVCPFFQEPCQNIAGKTPQDVFAGRIGNLEKQMSDLEARAGELASRLKVAEKAQQDLDRLKAGLKALEGQVEGLERRRRQNSERAAGLEALKASQAGAAARASQRRQDLEAFADLDGEIARADEERSRHQGARDAFFANLKALEELPGRRQTLEKYRRRLEELGQALEALKAERQELGEAYRVQTHQQVRSEREDLLSRVASLGQQLQGLAADCARLEGEIAELKAIEKEIAAKLAEKKTFGEKEALVKFLRNKVFKNVSAQLSERFREEITLRADRIYRTIAEADEELCWGEHYRVVLRDLEGGEVRERSDDQLSGGQMMSAVVALRLALLQTIGARVAFFDEPTSNLDAARRENLAQAFRAIEVGREEVTEHWYDQLFLVSHDVAFTEITDQMVEVGETA